MVAKRWMNEISSYIVLPVVPFESAQIYVSEIADKKEDLTQESGDQPSLTNIEEMLLAEHQIQNLSENDETIFETTKNDNGLTSVEGISLEKELQNVEKRIDESENKEKTGLVKS